MRVFFLIMAALQVLFAVRAIGNPGAAKEVNIGLKTAWAGFPLWFFRAVGVLCVVAAICFFYLFLYPPSN